MNHLAPCCPGCEGSRCGADPTHNTGMPQHTTSVQGVTDCLKPTGMGAQQQCAGRVSPIRLRQDQGASKRRWYTHEAQQERRSNGRPALQLASRYSCSCCSACEMAALHSATTAASRTRALPTRRANSKAVVPWPLSCSCCRIPGSCSLIGAWHRRVRPHSSSSWYHTSGWGLLVVCSITQETPTWASLPSETARTAMCESGKILKKAKRRQA